MINGTLCFCCGYTRSMRKGNTPGKLAHVSAKNSWLSRVLLRLSGGSQLWQCPYCRPCTGLLSGPIVGWKVVFARYCANIVCTVAGKLIPSLGLPPVGALRAFLFQKLADDDAFLSIASTLSFRIVGQAMGQNCVLLCWIIYRKSFLSI